MRRMALNKRLLFFFLLDIWGRENCMAYDEKYMMDWYIMGPTRSNREAKYASSFFLLNMDILLRV